MIKLAVDVFSVRCLLVFLVKNLGESLGIMFLYKLLSIWRELRSVSSSLLIKGCHL